VYGHLRSQRLEPPATERLHRLLRMAVAQREDRLVAEAAVHLSPATRSALDALVQTQAPENAVDTDQMQLFPVRSELAAVKEGAGAVKVETVLDEIAKLQQSAAERGTTAVPIVAEHRSICICLQGFRHLRLLLTSACRGLYRPHAVRGGDGATTCKKFGLYVSKSTESYA